MHFLGLDQFPVKTLVSVYYALIHSHISYALEVYGLTYSSNLYPLLTAQKRALRIILSKPPSDSITFAFQALHIPDVHTLVKYKVALLFHKLYHGRVSDCCVQLQRFQTPYSLRRQEGTLQPPYARTNFGVFSMSFHGTTIWNSLPADIKSLTNFIPFKRHLRAFLNI